MPIHSYLQSIYKQDLYPRLSLGKPKHTNKKGLIGFPRPNPYKKRKISPKIYIYKSYIQSRELDLTLIDPKKI